MAARTRTGPANLYPGAARQRTRDRAAPLDVPAAPGMERPSHPRSTQRAHGPAPCHPNLAGCHTALTTQRQSHGPTGGPPWPPSLRPAGRLSASGLKRQIGPRARHPGGQDQVGPAQETRMALDSGDSRQLAQAQTWTLLASQIIPPRKYSPCPRARMQDPTGPGPGIRTGSGRTPGRTAAAAHNPRHRTRNHPRRFHSQDADPTR